MLRVSTVLRQSVEWGNLLALANPQWRSQLVNIKRQHDELSLKLSTLPKEPPKIEWEKYRKVIENPTVIDELRACYEQNKIVPVDVSGPLKSIEAEQKQTTSRAEQYLSYVQSELNKLRSELQVLESTKPIDEMTVQDVFDKHPEVAKSAAAKRDNFEF